MSTADQVVAPVSDQRDLAVALSGGGHRATVFGLGAITALLDAGLGERLVSISSVSGGSIANGVLMVGPDVGIAPAAEIDAHVSAALHAVADRGVLLGGSGLNAKGLGKLVGAARRGAPATRGYIRALFGAAALAVVALVATIVTGFGHWWLALIVSALVLVLAGAAAWALFRRRSTRTEAAIDAELLGGAHITLGQLHERAHSVHHVICTTEIQTGNSFFFTNRCVYGYQHGGTTNALGVPLSTAVQASACVPGAFAPRRLTIETLGLDARPNVPAAIVVIDGGVYDNMADEWEYNIVGRAKSWPTPMSNVQPHAARYLVVVNASGGWNDPKPVGVTGLAQEIAGVSRAQAVQYDVSTSHRRRALNATFRTAEREHGGLDGVFVQITDSPYRLATLFAPKPDRTIDDIAERAAAAIAYLDAQPGYSEDAWRTLAAESTAVPTTLEALGGDVTAKLFEHGYVLTKMNLFVSDGIGSLDAPIDRSRLRAMCN